MPAPETAPFQPDDKAILLPTGEEVTVVYQFENEDQTGWGNVRVKDKNGNLFHANNWQLKPNK